MRLFLISFAIAFLGLLPQLADAMNSELPGPVSLLARVPSAGLGYMTVFFHELGHTVTFISYGQLAVPVFNFTDGGGFSQPILPRFYVLQGAIYIGVLFVAYLLFADGYWALLGCLIALLAVHACFTPGERYMLPVNYMGNGGAVLTGCFCIWRSALNKAISKTNQDIERYMHMIFGLFAVGDEGLLLSWKLLKNAAARDDYEAGIGENHIANDFTVLADRLEMNVQHIAAFHMLFTFAAIAVTCVLIYFGWRAQQEELAEAQAPVRRTRL